MKFWEVTKAATTVRSLIFHDLKHLFRRFSTSALLAALATVLLGFVLILGTYHHLVSVYAPFHGISNPKYAMGGYEPLLFYLCILVAIVLALRLPNYREDSIESVVVTHRSPSNFLLALSRVLAPTLLVALFLVALTLAYQGIAALDVATHPGIMEPLEPWSILFVLINLASALFVWTSLACLITEVFKSAVIGFLGTALILLVQAIVSPLLPWDLGSFTFGYSAAILFPTDLAPDYFQVKHLTYWLSVFCLSLALIIATATLHRRLDPAKRRSYVPFAVFLTSTCLVCQAVVHTTTILDASKRQSWLQAYDEASRALQHPVVVNAIEGQVRVVPGARVSIDLNYTVELPESTTEHTDSEALRVAFALNPGMKVVQASCNDNLLSYTHTRGVLEFDLMLCNSPSGDGYAFALTATGSPDPYYLIDHTSDDVFSGTNSQLIRLVGQRSSLFTSDYVALTPLSHWYPQPLVPPLSTDSGTVGTSMNVNLAVELTKKSWTLVTAGELLQPQNSAENQFTMNGEFRALTMLASDFQVEQQAFEGFEVNVLVHRRHARRFGKNEMLKDGIVRYVSDAIARLKSQEIPFPYNEFSIVEAPTTLSLLNKNRGTDLGMDAILLFRESGAPFARIDLLEEMQESAIDDPTGFFKEQVEYGISYYWTNGIFNQTYEDAVVNGVLSKIELAQEDQSQLSKMLMENLLLGVLATESTHRYRFDFGLANTLAPEARVNMRYIFDHIRGLTIQFNLMEFYENLLNSHAFWESIERTFSSASAGVQQEVDRRFGDFERQQRFRMLKLSEMIELSLDQETLASTIATITANAPLGTVDLKAIEEAFQSNGLYIRPMIQSTLLNTRLPGVNFSVVRQLQLDEPDDLGNRFVSILNLRSGEDVAAHVWFEIVEFKQMVFENIPHEVIAGSKALGPFELPGKSSHTLIMRTENKLGELYAKTFLSLNRGELEIRTQIVDSLPSHLLKPINESQWYSLVPSQWSPDDDQNSIVIDDLDPGFEAETSSVKVNNYLSIFGAGLFRSYFPREEGQDNGLPIASFVATHRGVWARSTWGACWGRYRHTYVFALPNKRPIQEVSFNTEIPRPGRWKLWYHLPSVAWSGGDFDFRITVGKQRWDLTRNREDWHFGWNELGTIDVVESGHARVALSNETNTSDTMAICADAVKWTYIDAD